MKLHKSASVGFCMGITVALLLGAPVLESKATGEELFSFAGINLDPAQGDLLGTEQDEKELLVVGRALLEEMEAENEYADLAIADVDSYVNVRSLPSTDGEILGKIYNGAVAHVIEKVGDEDEWFHVTSGSVEGYIKAEFFLYGKDAAEVIDAYVTRYALVHASRLNVRKEPTTESGRIGYLNDGEKAKIIEDLGDWQKVEYSGGQIGYVSADYTEVIEEFSYAISIEEERAEIARQKALEERKRQQEASAPENTVTSTVAPAAGYSTNSELRDSLVAYALQFVGNPYVSGGNSLTGGTDCSGFTKLIYGEYGYSLGRTPGNQLSSAGRKVDYSEIQKGDIICYSGNGTSCTHVAIYIGDGKIVHAANKQQGICVQNAEYGCAIVGVKNVID